MMNADRIMMKQAVAFMNGAQWARSRNQLPLSVFDAASMSVEEAEKKQFDENLRRVVAQAKHGEFQS